MDTNENTEEYDSLENAKGIDERVLNTPAVERKINIPVIDDEAQMETFLQFNKTREVKTDEGLVLDLGGEKATIDEGDFSKETGNSLFGNATGDLKPDGIVGSSAVFTIILISVALFGFLLVNFKRTEELGKLHEEISKLKNKTNKIV